jgi:DnaJ-class molecular chaperone
MANVFIKNPCKLCGGARAVPVGRGFWGRFFGPWIKCPACNGTGSQRYTGPRPPRPGGTKPKGA